MTDFYKPKDTRCSPEREQFLADIITSAIEGGIGYWSQTVRYRWADLPEREHHAVIVESEDEPYLAFRDWVKAFREEHGRKPNAQEAVEAGKAYLINIDTIARGLSLITKSHATTRQTRYGDRECSVSREGKDIHLHPQNVAIVRRADELSDAGEIDADAADWIVQVALFGEVVYG